MPCSALTLRRLARTALTSTRTAGLLTGCAITPGTGPMGFFVTSTGSGKGADPGGLDGAHARCKRLATAAGQRHWRACLSTSAAGTTQAAVHARDRIGKDPLV